MHNVVIVMPYAAAKAKRRRANFPPWTPPTWEVRERPPVATVEDIGRALAAANGRTRQYGCDWDDVVQAIDEALRTGTGARGGFAKFANAYGYQHPIQTAIRTRRLGRVLGIVLTITGRAEYKALVPWRMALRLTQERRVAARKAAAELLADIPHGVMVTREDSLAAGNCPKETDRVISMLPRGTQALASEALARVVAQRAPELLTYVRRAVKVAASRGDNAATGHRAE